MNDQNQINLTIDGKTISVPKGTTVYNAAKQHGIEIPIFCYLDRMPPFGACRMCLVEVEKMPKLQTSCTLEATEGMVVKTQSTMAEKGREEILELLLINHPLDCPICDRAGECPLQDNTMKFGPGKSRFFEEKRRFVKPIPLSPVLMLDRERCIVCARCTRFCDNLSGDHALEFIERGYKTEVGTPSGGTADSKFIGNTILICPVGALTSKVYRFRARPWDNKPTVSTCTLCPVGCSLYFDQRDGEIMRTRSHENREVNDIWLCDKGWFGYEFTSSAERLQQPHVRIGDILEPTSWEDALSLIAEKIIAAKPGGKIAGLGGNPLTFEENYLFQKLLRNGAGVNHIDHRIGMPIFNAKDEGQMPGMEMAIGDCEELSFAILLGLDLTEEFPVIWLRLRQAINHGADVSFMGHFAPEISPYFSKTLLHAPGNELDMIKEHLSKLSQQDRKGAIFVGSQYLSNPNRGAILSELKRFCEAQPNLTLNILEGNGNSMGARLAGMRPDLGPFGKAVNNPGLNALQVVEEAAQNGWDVLHVAGANPAAKYPANLWQEAVRKTGFLIVQDLFLTETAQQADVVLPSLCYAEKKGHFVNIEGRLQKLSPGKDIPNGVLSDGEIFIALAKLLNIDLELDEEFNQSLQQERIQFNPSAYPAQTNPIMLEGELKVSFAKALFDKGVRMQHDPHLIQLVKEPRVRLNPAEGMKRGIVSGEEVELKANGRTLKAKVKLDARVSVGTIVLPLGFPELPVQNLDKNLMNGMSIEINKVS